MSESAKRLRQVKDTIGILARDYLVDLPRKDAGGNKYERFELLHEGGQRRIGAPLPYQLPKASEKDTFAVPLSLFTRGWIHVLEDTELAVLLMLCALGAGTAEVALGADERAMRYGISRDAFDGHQLLERVGLVEVVRDPERLPSGKVQGCSMSGAHLMPRRFRLLADALDVDAYSAVVAEVTVGAT